MILNTCKTCKNTFVKPHNPNRVYHFCSLICMGKNKDKKANQSIVMSGKKAWNTGIKGLQIWHNTSGLKAGWNKGRKGIQTAWNKGISNLRIQGENNPNWKGGVTRINEKIRKSLEYKKWRTAVFARDKYTCQVCGDDSGGNLEADHIKQFAHYRELRFDINNGRTLCHECHSKTETYLSRGRKNTMEQIREYIS